jgi:cytochrome c
MLGMLAASYAATKCREYLQLRVAATTPVVHAGVSSSRRARHVWRCIAVSLVPAPALAQLAPPTKAFAYCAACHSLENGVNLTGPSLHGLWGRKAGTLRSFHRYSDALKQSGIVWNDQTLDAWIRKPAALVPGNDMRFPGIPDDAVRQQLIAFLRTATKEGDRASASSHSPSDAGGIGMGGMGMGMGGMGGGGLPELKRAPAAARVGRITYCDDTYAITTEAGKTLRFWEFNLRFKTDSSAKGPTRNQPVLVPQGMQGDRAQVVFASPDEIGRAIKRECKP